MEYAPAPSPRELEAGYRAAGFHTDAVIPRLLEKNVTEFGRSVAVIDDTGEVTWAELAEAAWRVAGLLQAHGIGPGDVVVWQLPNWWEALAVAHGVWAAGAISVPVVPIYREHELATIMAAVQPRAVIGPPEFRGHDHVDMLDAAARAAGAAPELRVVVRGEATGWLTWDDTQRAAPFRHDGIDPGAPVTVGFTSGTTSGAKGAVVNTRAMLTVPMRHARAVPYTFRDRGYMPAPVSHITGLLMAVSLPLVSGCSVLIAERWDAPKAVADMVRHGVTYSGGAAVFIQELVDAIEASGMESFPLSCGYNCGGSAISRELVERAEALGMKPRHAYGMTECPTVSASMGDDGPDIRLGTDGRILPGVDVRVVDDDGDVAPGAVGEFLVRGPQRVLGYLDSGAHPRRVRRRGLVPQWRPRLRRRPELHHRDRPHEGHHQPRRREAVGAGDRGPAVPSPGSGGGRGRRRAASASRRGTGRVHDPASRRDGVGRRGAAVPRRRGGRAAEDPPHLRDRRRPAAHRVGQGQEVRAGGTTPVARVQASGQRFPKSVSRFSRKAAMPSFTSSPRFSSRLSAAPYSSDSLSARSR